MRPPAFQPEQHLAELKRIAKYHSVYSSINIVAFLTLILAVGSLVLICFLFPQEKSLSPMIPIILSVMAGGLLYQKSTNVFISFVTIIGLVLVNNGIFVYNNFKPGSIDRLKFNIIFTIQLTSIFIFSLKVLYNYQKHCQITPNQTLYAWLKAEIEYINRRASFHDGTIIKFGINAGKTQIPWNGRLYTQCILLVSGSNVQILERKKFIVKRDNSTGWGRIKQFFVTDFIIDGKKEYGSIDETSYARYRHWGETATQSTDDWWVPWA